MSARAFVLAGVALGFLLWGFSSCMRSDTLRRDGESPAHHTADGFRNPYQRSPRGFSEFLKWQLGLGPREERPSWLEEDALYAPDRVDANLNHVNHPDPNQIQITWIGHGTFLVQVGGMNILTDPIFSERAAPVSFAGPRRLVPPGIALEDLPPIHAVILSHDHYDHLDAPTVERLGPSVRYFVPLGLGSWLAKEGITDVVELDWWDRATLGAMRIHAVPAQHFSGRTPFNRNGTLWMGWVLETKAGNVFFAGDTGYGAFFKEIGERFSPIRVSFIPIGAYRPRWFMGPMHVDPPEAVRVHQDLRSETSIAMHWGTFRLADEPVGEPPVYLKRALREAGVRDEEFRLMRFGETIRLQ